MTAPDRPPPRQIARPATMAPPALEFDQVALPQAALNFSAYPGESVHLSGGSPVLQRQALAIASGQAIPTAGRCRIGGIDTRVRAVDAAAPTLDGNARPGVAKALLDDTLNDGLPLLANVALPALTLGVPVHDALQNARDTLAAFGLAAQSPRPPPLLTTAQRRLALIARALAARPRLLVLEQPDTGLSTQQVSALRLALWALTAHHGGCVLMTSGHPRLIAAADRHVRLQGSGAVLATA